MLNEKKRNISGFSLLELLISMTVTLVLMALVSALLVNLLGIKKRESQRTDALTSTQAALNLLSSEIANSGYGLTNNGIVFTDSDSHQIHFRTNVISTDFNTNSPGEDVTYYFDENSGSIVRYDRYANPTTSAVINRVSSVTFQYFDYSGALAVPQQKIVPTINTGRIRIILSVDMDDVLGQTDDQTITLSSDVTLRNATYMLNQY